MSKKLPEGWKRVKLGDVFNITSGGTPSRKKNEYYEHGNIPWVKTGDLKQKYINYSSEYITEAGLENSSAKYFPKSTVLIAMYGATIGATSILRIDASTNQACAAFLPNNSVLPEYLYYYFVRNKESIISLGVGGAQPNISITILKSISIDIPTLEEQERIVSILEKAKDAIEKREESIKLLDELVKSRFIEMFGDPVTNPKGWEKASIGSKFEIKTGATPSRKENTYWKNGNIPWVKTTELKEVVINETEEYITTEGYNNSSVNLLPKDTVLIAMYGQGKTRGMTGKLGIEATTNQACASILPNSEENMDFIWYQLKLSYEDLRNLGRGGSQPNLNTNLIKSYELIFPPMELQDRFVEFIKQVDKLKFEMDNSLKELENNFKSLMQKAFNGEL